MYLLCHLFLTLVLNINLPGLLEESTVNSIATQIAGITLNIPLVTAIVVSKLSPGNEVANMVDTILPGITKLVNDTNQWKAAVS